MDVVTRRALPALYIVDEFLNVLFFREDPGERREDYRMQRPGTLPPLIERTVIALLRRTFTGDPLPQSLSAAPNGSILVRIMPLEGAANSGYAITVERFKLRRQLQMMAQRYALSARERQVLHLLAKGAKNSEIAQALQIAESTAVFHVKRLLSKTGSRNRTELVSKAVG